MLPTSGPDAARWPAVSVGKQTNMWDVLSADINVSSHRARHQHPQLQA
jgi:hypothetical protein